MLGSLEDLSLSDIFQIIFLSRRTGVLEVNDQLGRSTLMFLEGLIVGGSSPAEPDLITYLQNAYLGEDALPFLRMKEAQGVAAGSAVLELGLMTPEELRKIVIDRVRAVVKPILASREGQFNFILADSMSAHDLEYEPDQIFPSGGVTPQEVTAEGEKLKPFGVLGDKVRAARQAREAKSEPREPESEAPGAASEEPAESEAGKVAPLSPSPGETEEALLRQQEKQFRVGTASSQASGPLLDKERRIVVIEPDPLIRVAIRRSFGKKGVTTLQFGGLEEAQTSVQELIQQNRFFVTVVDSEPADRSLAAVHFVKRANRRLTVAVIHQELDAATRRRFTDAGADVFVRKPAPEILRSPAAAGELEKLCSGLFELTETAYRSWEQMSQSLGSEEERGAQFYEISQREKAGRSFGMLKQLITELSEPGDVQQITQTILRLAGEYVDRAVLFAVDSRGFAPLDAVSSSAESASLAERARRIQIGRGQPSVLRDVAETGRPHRGKLRREPANEHLISSLGGLLPTETVVLPVMNEEEVVGVLYGDNAENRTPIGNTAGLEIFLSQAGFALQNALRE